ncbi:MAG: GNAT family N-acetyltransferase [Alphaproteobacteria bacterium]|nr:GNAT family N-acetyltransferase [Alphaproteobacteria bacterium]
MTGFEITNLRDCPDLFRNVCAAWSYGEWSSQAVDTQTYTLQQALERYNNTASEGNPLMQTWMAVASGKPAGMISFKNNDHPDRPDIYPWLASLFVHPKYRQKGIATLLIKTVETEAIRQGFKEIFLFTSTQAGLYEKHGYKHMARIRDLCGINPEGDHLMRKELA